MISPGVCYSRMCYGPDAPPLFLSLYAPGAVSTFKKGAAALVLPARYRAPTTDVKIKITVTIHAADWPG